MEKITPRLPSDIDLKAAGASDSGLIARLHRLCFADAWSVDSVRDLLASPGVFARVAWRGPKGGARDGDRIPAGFVIHRIVSGESELMALGVAPDQRGRGLGRLLLDLALAEAGQSGVRAMFLEVAVDNPAAQNLYLEQGFKQVGRRSAYYRLPDGRQVDALVFRRLLPSPVG